MTTPLASYLGEQGIGDAEFAESVDRDRTMISKLRRGLIKPTLELAAAIEEKTGGRVPMQSWVRQAAPAPEVAA